MAVVINGNGTVTGVTTLPDGIVTNDDLAGSINQSKLAGSIALSKLATTGTGSSSNFLRGDGAYAAAGGGLHTQIGSTSDVTDVSSIAWESGISGYKTYVIIGEEIIAVASTAYLQLQIGESSGYKTDSNYGYHTSYSPSSSTSYAAINSGGSGHIRLDYSVTHHANSTYNFILRFHYMAGRRFSCSWEYLHYEGGSGYIVGGHGKGDYMQALTFDRLKIFTGGGNLTGRFRLFGI